MTDDSESRVVAPPLEGRIELVQPKTRSTPHESDDGKQPPPNEEASS